MKLTEKDKEFLERLRGLVDEKHLRVQLKDDKTKRLVLRQNYGDFIESNFGMTRQGVRWRFQHLMNAYVSAYETILWLESTFGTEVRSGAIAIAQQRAEQRRDARDSLGPIKG